LIFASVGTVPDPSNLPMFQKMVAACAGVDAQLVLALGKWTDYKKEHSVREKLGNMPGRAIVVDFAPQLALLEKAAVLITHAGQNSVMESLSRASPWSLCHAAPTKKAWPRGSTFGGWAEGVLPPCHARRVAAVIERVLTEEDSSAGRENCKRRSSLPAARPRAAEIAEEALTTGRPVLRK